MAYLFRKRGADFLAVYSLKANNDRRYLCSNDENINEPQTSSYKMFFYHMLTYHLATN